MNKERKTLKGFKDYKINAEGVVISKPHTVTRGGFRPYVLPGKTLSITLDKGTGYSKVMLRNNDGKSKNLLLHRVVYCAFNRLDYTNKALIVCHVNDDRTSNELGNLYGGTQKDNMHDIQLKNWLLGMYKQGKIIVKD